MIAVFTLEPSLLLAVLGILATGWGVSRSGAVAGWKSVAEARKERILEIESSQTRAEEQIVTLNKRIAELEQMPDLREIREEVRARHAEVVKAVRELKEAVDDVAAKWG